MPSKPSTAEQMLVHSKPSHSCSVLSALIAGAERGPGPVTLTARLGNVNTFCRDLDHLDPNDHVELHPSYAYHCLFSAAVPEVGTSSVVAVG